MTDIALAGSTVGVIADMTTSVMVLLGAVVAVIAWFYTRGGQEKSYAESLADNTAANREVAAELRDFKAQTVTMLHDLDTRVAVLESQRGKDE